MAKLSKKTQDELISAEINRITKLLHELDEERKESARGLIENIAFMKITLDILQDSIKTSGPVTKFEQGKQKMIIENPAQKSYNTMINRYTAACKMLFDLLPKQQQGETDDGFEAFVCKR